MNAKIPVLDIYAEVMVYLLLCDLHDCTFKRRCFKYKIFISSDISA